MATIRKYWRCSCRNPETGKARGYKKVFQNENAFSCPHCGAEMYLAESNVARVTVNGRTVTHSTKAKTVAKDFIDECRRSKRTGDLLPGQEQFIPWNEAVRTFENWMESSVQNKELRSETQRYYLNGLKPLQGNFEGLCLQEMEKKHVEQFKTERKRTVSASTVNCSLAALKRMFTVVCDELRARDYPRLHEAKTDIFKAKLLELDNANDIFLETDDEIEALLSECRTLSLFKFVFTILNTGLRPTFALNLKKSDFNFRANHIKKNVKGGTQVIIPLTEQYKSKVDQWFKDLKVMPLDPWLIPSPLHPMKCMKNDANIGFGAACERAANKLKKAGKKEAAERLMQLTPHNLRHTFATHYLYRAYSQHGNALAAFHDLAQILGHSTTYITERYSHVLNHMSQGAMQKFGVSMFSNISTEPNLTGQPRCECGAYLQPDGTCKRCGVGIHVGNK